jgi:hypothetical protein
MRNRDSGGTATSGWLWSMARRRVVPERRQPTTNGNATDGVADGAALRPFDPADPAA